MLLFPTVCKGGRAGVCCSVTSSLPSALSDGITGTRLGGSFSVDGVRVIVLSEDVSTGRGSGVFSRVSSIGNIG